MEPIGSVSGLASGIDFRQLTEQIITLERRPAARLEAKVDAATKRSAAITTYRGLLGALQSAATALKNGTAFDSYTTTVSGSDSSGKTLLSASASSGAVPGAFRVEVLSLAQAQKNVGTTQPSAADALGYAGTFSINGTEITVAATDSLATIRDAINAQNTGANPTKVTASILGVSPTDQRLILTSDVVGSAGAFALADVSGSVLGSLGLNAPPQTTAADAQLTVDGVAITRSSNTITDAIQGVTLTLTTAEAGKFADVKVERYASSAQGAAQAFVDAYNKLVTFIKEQGTVKAGVPAPLYGDGLLRTDRAALAGAILAKAAGSPADLDTFAAAGISLTRDGTLTLDTAKFNTAYSDRFGELRGLLAERGGAVESLLTGTLQSGTGTLALKETAITDQIAAFNDRILAIDTRLERRKAALIRQFTVFEATIGRLRSISESLGTQFKALTADREP